MGIRMVSRASSVCPKLSTFSLKVPMTVNCNPWTLMIWPMAAVRLPKRRRASSSVSSATFWRSSTSLASMKRPAVTIRLRTVW